jgi:hypothetical protein
MASSMLYYFDIRDGVPVRDKTGKDFECISAAISHAVNLAAQCRNQGEPKGENARICVVREDGTIVHEVKF